MYFTIIVSGRTAKNDEVRCVKLRERLFGRAGEELASIVGATAKSAGARRAVMCLFQLGLGFLSSQAVIFREYSPFGLGFAAAAGAELTGISGVVGVIAGYALQNGRIDSFKYMAACALIFATWFIFRDSGLMKRSFFMPAAAGLCAACVGFVFVAERGFPAADIVFYITEVLIVVTTAYFYRFALAGGLTEDAAEGRGGRAQQSLGLKKTLAGLILASTLLIPAAQIQPFGISLGRIIALLLVLAAGLHGGVGGGSAAGIALGLSVDIALTGTPFFSMLYALSGLVSGAFSKAGRLMFTCSYVIANAAGVLLGVGSGGNVFLPALYEAFIASVIFMLLPPKATSWIAPFLPDAGEGARDTVFRTRGLAKTRLESASKAFRELHDSLAQTFESLSRTNDADISKIFDRAAERVCRKCALRSLCWERDSVSTYNALSDAAAQITQNGRARAEDFPSYFSLRCLNFPKFAAVVNEELTAGRYRRQFRSRMRESREIVCGQFGELSNILSSVAGEISCDRGFDLDAERRIEKCLRSRGFSSDVSAYREAGGRLHIELVEEEGMFSDGGALLKALSEAAGVMLRAPDKTDEGLLHLSEAERFQARVGVASHKREGETVSGDSGAYFKTEQGRLYAILSDGMGSGGAASKDSSLAIRLLERFLRAGVDPESALKTLNSALILRYEEDAGFSTVDLLSVDLFTGEAAFYKFGASPSYVKRGRSVGRVTCSALPAGVGISEIPTFDVTRVRLHSGDTAVIVSDGVTDGLEDDWLRRVIADSQDEAGAKELASNIMKASLERPGAGDDMTAIVLRLSEG